MGKKRKIILYIATSLDGYIARKNGDVDWLFTDQDYGYQDFYKAIDTILFGSKTYDQVLTFGKFPYGDRKCFVFTRTKRSRDDHAEFVTGDIVEFINKLQNNAGMDIWLIGGADLIEVFLANNLIDEYKIFVHPLILGDGIPLFKKSFKKQKSEINIKLENIIRYSSGLVQLYYKSRGNSIV